MATNTIDKKDRFILEELERNSRRSNREIAKKLNMSKEIVNYRIKKLVENGTITRFFAEIDASRLGLILYKGLFQFQNVDTAKEQEIFDFLKKRPEIGWVARSSGRWDLVFVSYVKNVFEQAKLIQKISEKYGDHLISKEYCLMVEYYVCNRNWFYTGQKPETSKIGGVLSPLKIDKIDKKILRTLAADVRTPIVDIARNLGVSSSRVIQRIKRLEKNKIIARYCIGINYENLDLEFCKAFLYFQNITPKSEKDFLEYCELHPHITAISYMVAPWEVELELEVDSFEEFYDVMDELKNRFKDLIRNYESIVITKEYGRDYSTIIV